MTMYRATVNGVNRKTAREAYADAAEIAARYTAEAIERGDPYPHSGDVPIYRMRRDDPTQVDACTAVVRHNPHNPYAVVCGFDRNGYTYQRDTVAVGPQEAPR
jgi:hypothetical protein